MDFLPWKIWVDMDDGQHITFLDATIGSSSYRLKSVLDRLTIVLSAVSCDASSPRLGPDTFLLDSVYIG